MSEITARIPLIDWEKGFEKHWNKGSPAITHVFNALSFMFPQGERFFIKVAKEVSEGVRLPLSPTLADNLNKFVVQEATHAKQHQQYNKILEEQGYDNVTYDLIEHLNKTAFKYFSPIQRLAFVCAYEHYTAILGNFLLQHPEVLKFAPKQMSLIWGWHAVEETEHKAVCFDLYKEAGGSSLRRILSFFLVSFEFFLIFNRLYFSMLWKDGSFHIKKLPKTLLQATNFFWGKTGVGWHILVHGTQYLSPSFHPWKLNNKALVKSWLIRNNDQLKVI